MTRKRIHKRGLTAFFTLFGFVVMSVTGLVLYLEPTGSVAYWTTWQLMGLTKSDWDNIHILSSILFIVAGGFHIYFNWKPLINYFRDRVSKGVKLGRELAIVTALSVWVVVSGIWPFPPLSYLLDFNEWIKETWIVQDEYAPPFGHAERLSLSVFSKKMEIDIEKAVTELRSEGIVFEDPQQTLEDIAAQNEVAPMELYLLIRKFEPVPEPDKLATYTPEAIEVEFAGTGIGNKTISAVCERLGLDTAVAMARLAAAGIPAEADQTMKTAAEAAETESIEIMKVILLDGYQPERSEP